MPDQCSKCGGRMEPGRIANKFLFGFKAARQRHWSFEANVQKASGCLSCGFIEMYVDPQQVARKLTTGDTAGA